MHIATGPFEVAGHPRWIICSEESVMLTRLLTLMCLASSCVITSVQAAPLTGVHASSAALLPQAAQDSNPVKPAVLEIPMPNQSHRAARATSESEPFVAPAAVQWLTGPLPLRCKASMHGAASNSRGYARSCLVI
jgi:hypothetical protein